MKKTFILIFLTLSLPLSAVVLPPHSSPVEAHVLRLEPGEDPKLVLMNYVKQKNIKAASIASVVGSLSLTVLRYANKKELVKLDGFREVISLSGTVSTNGSHLHLSVSDGKGETLGGHLGEGSKVYTTLEIVLLSYPSLSFERKKDSKTTFEELTITSGR